MTKNLMVLSSTVECRKALTWLAGAGFAERTLVELRGAACPSRVQGSTEGQDILLGHQLVVLDHNKLQCRFCGKVFRSKCRELRPVDRILFAKTDPRVPFSTGAEQLLEHSYKFIHK